MNILLIGYLFPPVVNPQSILNGRFAKYLQMAGHKVTVLAASNTEVLNSSHGVDPLLNRDLREVKICYVTDRIKKGCITDVMKRLINHEGSRYWVDRCIREILPACEGGQFNVIYSLAFPMASNILGMYLKRKTGIPWVAHFSDPGFLAFNRRFKSPIRTYLTRSKEMNIFRFADGITFVNQETLVRNTAFKPAYREKCMVIPHMFDPDCFRDKQDDRVDKETLRLSYVGSLYGKRNPFNAILSLQRAIASMEQSTRNVEFHLYGSIDSAIQKQLDEKWVFPWLKLHGPIGYGASIQAMLDSDYLILLDWSGEDNLFFPSKLVDYLAACRSIIGITSLKSYSARLLTNLEYPLFDFDDVDGLTRLFCSLLSGTRLEIASRHSILLGDFRADRVTEQLAQFLASKSKLQAV